MLGAYLSSPPQACQDAKFGFAVNSGQSVTFPVKLCNILHQLFTLPCATATSTCKRKKGTLSVRGTWTAGKLGLQ